MAYVAVSGGEEAIAASIALLDFYRSKTEKDVELEVKAPWKKQYSCCVLIVLH